MALIVTPGAANADSYIDLDGANAYFDTLRATREAWDAVSNHEELLRTATLILEQLDYVGIPVTDTQALKWPRQLNDDGDLIRNYPINVIPNPIKYAQCEIAYWLADTGGTSTDEVSELQIGDSVRARFAGGGSTSSVIDYSGLPIAAARFLAGLRLHSVLA